MDSSAKTVCFPVVTVSEEAHVIPLMGRVLWDVHQDGLVKLATKVTLTLHCIQFTHNVTNYCNQKSFHLTIRFAGDQPCNTIDGTCQFGCMPG